MNENPYASPGEVVEIADDIIYEKGLRRLAWGIFWILVSSIMMAGVFVIVKYFTELDTRSFLLSRGAVLNTLHPLLIITAFIGIPITQLIGLVCCGFCPNRLVKRGWLYVIGSVALLVASICIPTQFIVLYLVFSVSPSSFTMENLCVVVVTASILVWQVFLLRLAYALESAAGKRLAWSLIVIFCLLAVGVIAWMNILYIHRDPPLSDFWWRVIGFLQDLGPFVTFICVIVYALLLNMLRRRMKQVMEEEKNIHSGEK